MDGAAGGHKPAPKYDASDYRAPDVIEIKPGTIHYRDDGDGDPVVYVIPDDGSLRFADGEDD